MNINKFSREYLMECLSYNEDTGDLVWKTRPSHHWDSSLLDARFGTGPKIWNSQYAGRIAGTRMFCRGASHRISVMLDKVQLPAHGIIAKMMGWDMAGKVVDHSDGNPFNNKLSNLQAATMAENRMNSSPHPNKHGLRGVRLMPVGKLRWTSKIMVDGSYIHLGCFYTKGMAAAAYAKASIKHHGRFSPYLNR